MLQPQKQACGTVFEFCMLNQDFSTCEVKIEHIQATLNWSYWWMKRILRWALAKLGSSRPASPRRGSVCHRSESTGGKPSSRRWAAAMTGPSRSLLSESSTEVHCSGTEPASLCSSGRYIDVPGGKRHDTICDKMKPSTLVASDRKTLPKLRAEQVAGRRSPWSGRPPYGRWRGRGQTRRWTACAACTTRHFQRTRRCGRCLQSPVAKDGWMRLVNVGFCFQLLKCICKNCSHIVNRMVILIQNLTSQCPTVDFLLKFAQKVMSVKFRDFEVETATLSGYIFDCSLLLPTSELWWPSHQTQIPCLAYFSLILFWLGWAVTLMRKCFCQEALLSAPGFFRSCHLGCARMQLTADVL